MSSKPDFPGVISTEATTHMVQALVVASAYFEVSSVSRGRLVQLLTKAMDGNEWAQKAALIWFDALTAEYENDARLHHGED